MTAQVCAIVDKLMAEIYFIDLELYFQLRTNATINVSNANVPMATIQYILDRSTHRKFMYT